MHHGIIRVAHITEAFLGGICTHLCTILPELVRGGFDVTLIVSLGRSSPDAHARLEELRRSGIRVHLVPMRRGIHPLEDARSLLILARLLSGERFDIVHTHGSKAGALGRIAAALVACPVRLHTPHCFAFLRNGSRPARRVYLGCERVLGRLTTHLVAVAPSEADITARCRIAPPHRCTVIRNALSSRPVPAGGSSVGPAHDAGPFARKRNEYVVTTVCRLVDYKGVFRFLHAALLSKTCATRFLIAGDGELRASVQDFIVANHLEHKVRLLGYVRNMTSLYAASDLVVLCSDAEATPYCLLEAMRARCAIVATAVTGNGELVTHDQTGVLVRPDPAEIARAIDDLLPDEAKRREMADNAYAYFCRHHVLEQQITRLSELYRRFVHGDPGELPQSSVKTLHGERG